MRIFLTGGTGFIGGHLLAALARDGHSLTCLVRERSAARLRPGSLPGVTLLPGDFTQPESWLSTMAEHEGVINCVGIIRETETATFDQLHAQSPAALFDAAAAAGVRKVIQISALGADEAATGQYLLTKRAADLRLQALDVPHVILRPSLVYGAGDHSMALFRRLARLPVTPVPGDGGALLQPMHVQDLVTAVRQAVDQDDLAGVAVNVGGRAPVTLDAMLDRLAGPRGARKVHLPWRMMELAAAVTDRLGGRGPITGEELALLRAGSHCDNSAFIRTFGFEPMSLEAGLALRETA